MNKLTFALLSCLPIAVQAAPFADSDPEQGKKLFAEKNCGTCHVSMFGGDGSKIFTRADRKIKTPEKLLSQIQACNANLGARLFPEDEAHIAAHLNRDYYKFK